MAAQNLITLERIKKRIHDACRQGDGAMVESLIGRENVDVNSFLQGWTFLQTAMCHDQPSVVASLLANPDSKLHVRDGGRGRTGLHWACLMNSSSVITMFTKVGSCNLDILNMKDDDGEAALMIAVRRGNIDCVKELQKLEGIDFGTENMAGETVLEVAEKCSKNGIVTFLEENIQARKLSFQVLKPERDVPKPYQDTPPSYFEAVKM